MTEKVLNNLDPLTLPLFGERLIEASAGTGKTFTIGVIYLRLLLGLGREAAFFRPLSVTEILVVTFTESATEELRGRIRSNIRSMRLACIRKKSEETLFSTLLDEIKDLSSAAMYLLSAERQMDEAAIYTIHGFCQRMLTYNAFESGTIFEYSLVHDELPIRRQACSDFWRRYCYPLPLNIARMVIQEWSGPEALLSDLSRYLHGEEPKLRFPPHDKETILTRHEKIIKRINAIKAHWKKDLGDLEQLIYQSDANKRIYNRKNLVNWLGKVNEWAMKYTLDYQIPKELYKFRQSILIRNTKQGQAPHHALFIAIDKLFSAPSSLRDLIIARALKEIRGSINNEKQQRGILGFDDLLTQMDAALHKVGEEQLATAIRHRYPIAIIDEFQDTDPQQYRIFRKLYANQPGLGFLLIGDPKQAIYAFRGANIFTYMHARSDISARYTLKINWRSSPAMVSSVNALFCQLKNPFLFDQIPFLRVSTAKKNKRLMFELHNQSQPAIQFWLQKGEGVGVTDYQKLMARLCATQICSWLNAAQKGLAWLDNGKDRKPVQASNIAVLVRSHNEATLIRDALSVLSIPSMCLSNQDSIFETQEAIDLRYLLQAVLVPEQEDTLRNAMATELMGLNALTFEALSSDELAWDALVDEFDKYRTVWMHRGVLPMLREVMKNRHIAENFLASPKGERRLINLLHLGELLQKNSVHLDSTHALVRWLTRQITHPNRQIDNEKLRMESDCNLVQISTIHKSKGLEFDLVWLPFIGSFQNYNQGLYHDRESFHAVLDLKVNEDSLNWVEEERLSEDLRLLYVALTRAVYHSSIGIAPLMRGARKRRGCTDVHRSALGYLVQSGKVGNADYLYKCLKKFSSETVKVSWVPELNEQTWKPDTVISMKLSAKNFTRQLQDYWRVTSYTGLREHTENLTHTPLADLNIKSDRDQLEIKETSLTPHTFPRGIVAGTFLHSVLEKLDFSRPLSEDWLLKHLNKYGFSDHWKPILLGWINTLLSTPLNENGLILSALTPRYKQAELEFYLPINRLLHAHELDQLVKFYDPLSARCPPLNFQCVQGMLKGLIDLVFYWKGKYYLLDYKSNWLGESSNFYTRSAIEGAMIEHRYDLQYQFYTLAIHRYLYTRLVNYDYELHFGGVIYLFLRGIKAFQPGHGVFFCRPERQLIEEMNILFNNHSASEEYVQ